MRSRGATWAFDTSVFVPALIGGHDHHAAALVAVQNSNSAGRTLIPIPALVETFAVLIRLPAPFRLSSAHAHDVLKGTFAGTVRLTGIRGPEGWELLDSILLQKVSGGAAYDAHVAACAHKAGASRLFTFNRKHFERLDLGELEFVVPGSTDLGR